MRQRTSYHGAVRAVVPLPRPWTRRLPAVASVAYVAALAAWVDAGREPASWLVGLLATVLALVTSGSTRATSRTAGWGVAIVTASLAGHHGDRVLDAVGALGVFFCTAAACVDVARIAPDGGLAEARAPRSRAAVLATGVAWWLAVGSRFVPREGPLSALAVPSSNPDGALAAQWAAIAASVAALLGFVEWTLRRRRYEIGVVERATAMRALASAALGAGAVVAVLSPGRAESAARFALASAAGLICLAAAVPDAVRVGRIVRRTVVLAIVGGSVALLGATAAEGSGSVWTTTLVTSVAVLLIGSAARAIEAPMRPASGAWLDAFARAGQEALRADPEDAMREALLALRAPTGIGSPSPELWTFHPMRVATVDSGGYLHEADGEIPEALVLLASAEPEQTLRSDVLDALEVRRPDLRPLARWMTGRGAMLATAIASEGEMEGVIVLPRGTRSEPPTLEEVRALREVADALARACQQRSAQSRMLARVREATGRAEEAEDRALRLTHERTLDRNRDALAAVRLARPASVGVYSAASRAALEALERRTAAGASVAVVAPSGVDPVPYLARAHLAGVRRDGPLVLVDSTSAREHDVARWTNAEVSPLALADRGMLVLLDAAALPVEVQELVARACAEKRPPWERPDPIDVELALTGTRPPEQLVTEGRLLPALALRLADAAAAPVCLPRLRDRPDDLRSILTDRLAREGLRVLGRPVGIDHAAYARLVDYPFPGEDAELAGVVRRLVAACAAAGRDVVRAQDVTSLELNFSGDASSALLRKDPISA
jgi:hypothetical protein